MVALGVLHFLTGGRAPLCEQIARMTRSPLQIDSLSWALVTAISMKDTSTIEALVQKEPQLSVRKHVLADPLRFAVTSQWYTMVRYLLQHGADVNTPHNHSHCSPKCERMLIELPSYSGDVRMVALLLEPQYSLKLDGADCDRYLWSTIRKLAASHTDGTSPSASTYIDIVRLFLQTIHPNNQASVQHLVVHLAVVYDVPELIPVVVEMGFDVNETEAGRTHLVFAVSRGQNKVVNVLLDHGARHGPQSAFDAVKAACINGRASSLRILLNRVTTIDEYGHALAAGHFLLAAKASWSDPETMSHYIEVLDCLSEHGLDLNSANCGVKALTFALEHKHNVLMTNLLEKGISLPDAELALAQRVRQPLPDFNLGEHYF
ncbi:Ankyrin repeat-containing protein [Cladophialophora immunda]|nr:Ankyrin repeat-containing protein [Cladophialophora immunda]